MSRSEQMDPRDRSGERARMVDDIAARGVQDPAVLEAMRSVPRERFVSSRRARLAYEDHPLPIAAGQTTSQPLIVALMAEAAEIGAGARVLEVGTGSGYGAAVLSRLADEVFTVERHGQLARSARRTLAGLGCANAHVVQGDGTLGLPDAAPFEAIVVTAGGPALPEALLHQLTDGGRLIMPVGPHSDDQTLIRVRRRGSRFLQERLGAVRFVPLIGEQGFAEGTTDPGS